MKRPTHRDIARIAGVSHVTVSLALRGHHSIPKVTRERIEAVAKQIGYRPDPALQALMVYRRGAKPSGYQGTLAWINNFQQNPEKLKARFSGYFLGAQERSAELGYQMEEFRLADFNMNFSRLSKVFRARNIQGLLFPPQDRRRHISRSNLDWENYCLIAFGFSLMRPQLDVVTNAQYRSSRLAMRKLRSLGYRRIGFVIESRNLEKFDQNFLAGVLIEQRHLSPSLRIPSYLIPQKSEAERKEGFLKWFLRHSPEVVLFMSGNAREWLLAMDPTKRNRCSFAIMDVPEDDTLTSGINQNNRIIGRTGVDMLIAKMHANERGVPTTPRCTLVDGRWVAGMTAPRITGN